MSHPFEFLSTEFCQRLTLTLLHMLWIGTAVGIVVVAFDRLLQRSSARTRYAVNAIGLLVMLCSLPATYAVVSATSINQIMHAEPSRSIPSNSALAQLMRDAGMVEIVTENGRFTIRSWGATSLSTIAPYATAAYLAGLCALLSRLSIQFGATFRLRRRADPVTDTSLLDLLYEMTRRLGLKRIPAMVWSNRINAPSVVGVIRPIIVLPLQLATGLGPDEMRAVMTHELAHIRRYDPLMHLVQSLAESLLFFHPFVWIVSRRVSIERENCCDDAVLASGWEPVDYAQSLVRLAEVCSVVPTTAFDNRLMALAATGDRSSAFSSRIRRLVGVPALSRPRLYRSGSLAVAIAGAAIVFAAVFQPVRQTFGNGEVQANENRASGKSKHDPGESIYNDKLRRFKFKLDEDSFIADHEFAMRFFNNYCREKYPKILGVYSDPQTNSIVVIGPPEAEQYLRQFIAKWRVALAGLPLGGTDELHIKKRHLERERSTYIQEMAHLETIIIEKEASEDDPKKHENLIAELKRRKKYWEKELDVVERQLAVVVEGLRRIEADLPY